MWCGVWNVMQSFMCGVLCDGIICGVLWGVVKWSGYVVCDYVVSFMCGVWLCEVYYIRSCMY